MIFREERIDDAFGLILAHSLSLPQMMLKKGRVLNAADIRLLKAAGINFLTGARLESDDVGENEAAGLIAHALAGPGVTINAPFTGRCNLFTTERGLLVYDRDRLDRINMVDEAVTVATAPPFERVGCRQMVATVKIIPFGVNRHTLDACAAFASTGEPLISVRPFRPLRAVLISTTLPGLKDGVMAATAAVTRARVEALGGTLAHEIRCPHDIGQVERALAKALGLGADLVLIAGASATVDRRDVVPSAVLRAGGSIDHFGMPADPGNLLLLAHVGAVAVVNLPGCARSSKPNGLDWVLARIAAGVAIKPADIMRMGAGGLLKQLGARPGAHAWLEPPMRHGRVAAVLTATTRRAPLAELEAALAAGLDPIVIMGGDEDMAEELPPCEVTCVGDTPLDEVLAALPGDVTATMVLPDGSARLSPEAVAEVVKAFDPDEGRAIVMPAGMAGERAWGLVGREWFTDLAAHGLGAVAARHGEALFELVLG